VLHRPDPAGDPVERPLHVVREVPRSPAETLLATLGRVGPASWREVIEASGLPQSTAYAAFGRLVDEGRAASPRRGVWALKEDT
jgi:hypothetical protein